MMSRHQVLCCLRFATILLSILTAVWPVVAQSSDMLPPAWIKNKPAALSNSYRFEDIVTDNGANLNSARVHSLRDLVKRIGSTSTVANYEDVSGRSTTKNNNGKTSFDDTEIYSIDISIADQDVTLHYVVVDEYYEIEHSPYGERFKLYTLYAVANSPDEATFDNFKVTDHYGVSGLWRSAIVPGWGQFHKGQKLKGGLMLGGTAAAAAMVVYSENMRRIYISKAQQTHDINLIRKYINQRNNFTTARNAGICAAGTLYVYNLVDAIVSPGARRVVVTRRNGSYATLSAAPTFSADGAAGFVAQLEF